jgi:hypothetical protein
VQLFRNGLSGCLGQLRALGQGGRVVSHCKLLYFGKERLERGGLRGQALVVISGGGEGGQRQFIRNINARVPLRLIGTVVEVQNLRKQDDAERVVP